jgi:hypothetical protein
VYERKREREKERERERVDRVGEERSAHKETLFRDSLV